MATKKVVLKLLAGEAIDTLVESVITRSQALGPDVHKAAVQCLMHAEKHADPRKLDRLMKGLHASNRPAALKTWAEKYSPIRWNGDDKVGLLKTDAKKYTPFDISAADANPYWNKSEPEAKPLTLAALRTMIAQMEKKLSKDNVLIAEGENIVVMKAYVARMKAADEAAANSSAAAAMTIMEGAATKPVKVKPAAADPDRARIVA